VDYAIQNAAKRVRDYFYPRPGESSSEAFERAKAESVKWQKEYLADTNALTYEQFSGARTNERTPDESAARWAIALTGDVLKLPEDQRDKFLAAIVVKVNECTASVSRISQKDEQ